MQIRTFLPGDAPTLRTVFHSSVHQLARQHYTTAQLQAWAPAEYDAAQWAERLRTNRPWVAEVDGCIAGFADLQPSGHIDPFFVAGEHAGRGMGRALMAQIHSAVQQAGMHNPAMGRYEPERQAVFQPQRLCRRGAPADVAARSGAGKCTHGQQAAFCFFIDSCQRRICKG